MMKKYYTFRINRTIVHILGIVFIFGFGCLLIALPSLDSARLTGSINADLRAGTDGTQHNDEDIDDLNEPIVVVEYDPAEAARKREEAKQRARKAKEQAKSKRDAATRIDGDTENNAEISRESDRSRARSNPERVDEDGDARSEDSSEKDETPVVRIKLPNGMKGCARPSPYGRGYVVNHDENGVLDSACRMDGKEVTRNIRNTTIHALCAVEELNHISRLSSEQRKTLDSQILVDDAHQFMYCFVPKVACSNWKRVIKYMNGKVPDLDTPMKMDHHKDLVFLSDFSDAEVDYRLKNYYKFMFVRDPTERLLSAYRNKFGENIGTYNAKYGPKIIAKYRKPGERIEGSDQSRITFEEFLRFLVDSDTRRMDPHWRPMWELCQPCAVKYDFIGSFEQLTEDAEHVLDRVRGDSDAHFPKRQSWYKPTTEDKKSRELNKVHPKYMKQVVDKYARDYMLFGYNPPVSEVTRPKL